MSIARHHADWLSLVPVSGPFLSLPVLMEAFNAGLEPHDPDQSRLLRQEYGTWQDSLEKRKNDPALLRNWIKFVLTSTLDLDERVLAEGQAIPQTLQVEVPEHREFLRPNIVVKEPSTNKSRLLVQTYPRSQELTNYVVNSSWKASPDTRMTELLHATGVRLGLVTNGEHWMLVDAPKGETTGYVSWYAETWLEEPITLRAFRSLLSASRFFNVPDDQTLEALLTKSATNQQEVTEQLGYQVRRAVEVLIHSLDRADQDFGRELLSGVKEEVLYESALTIMMRLVFLFCAEERELIPSKPFPVYEQNYSVSTISKQLRELADQHGEELLERRYDAWPRLLAAFRAVYGGLQHDDVHIPAYGGNLFNPDRFPFLEGRKLGTSWKGTQSTPLPVNNRTVLHLLEALQMLQIKVPGGGATEARRLSFRALDIEQIGHVYEGLLDHTAKRAAEPFLGLAGTRSKEPEISLAKLELLLDKGEAELLKFLKEETGKSENALKKSLKAEIDPQDTIRFRTACQGNEAFWKRVQPLAGLIRLDNFGYPVIIPQGSVFVTSGTDRRSSGTHYTPRSLTEPIVQYTLEPLVYVGPAEGLPKSEWKLKSAKELLSLKICDMACGSGAFLVQTARYMAERLLEAWEVAKQSNPNTPGITPEGEPSTGKANESLIPTDPAEQKTYAMRIIAQRCLYGVDINPLAVEMAKLSLWLLTLAKDKPFEFLDHSIRCGDSLVGLHSIDQLKNYSLKEDSKIVFEWPGEFDEPVDAAISLRLKLEDLPANTVEDIQRQETLLNEANDKIARLRCAADLLVAAEFWGENTKDKLERVRHAAVKTGFYVEKGPTEEFEQIAAKERRGQKMFHWPLEFPEVIVKRGGFDAFVGNPPFVGGSRISTLLGDAYTQFILNTFDGCRGLGRIDLCAFFFRRAFDNIRHSFSTFGFLATNTIAQGDTRLGSLEFICSNGGVIFEARRTFVWPGEAKLHASWVCIARHGTQLIKRLDERPVTAINTLLDPFEVVSEPNTLHSNKKLAFRGSMVAGEGFVISHEKADELFASNTIYRNVIFPYLTGEDLNQQPDQQSSRSIIDFKDMTLVQASTFSECLAIVASTVKPQRESRGSADTVAKWWQFGRRAVELYEAIEHLPQVVVCSQVTKHFAMCMVPTGIVYSSMLVVFPFDDWSTFSLLQSSFHETWAREYASSLKSDLRYTPSTCFETFPVPSSHRYCETQGRTYHAHRHHTMSSANDGLTTTYNRFHDPDETSVDIQKLRDLHIEMDQAVAAAYGWTDLELGHGFHKTKQGIRFTISEPARREVLQRLLKLNHQRYAEEVAQGLHGKKGATKKAAPKNKAASKPAKQESSLFDMEDDE